MREAITISESARLVSLEAAIERGIATFIEVGESLAEIRESRLYRIEYDTFEDYCREKWGMSRYQAHRLIGAAAVTEMLPIGNKPTAESQVRPLAQLEPARQVEAWAAAVETAKTESPTGKPTARIVEAEVQKIKAAEPIKPTRNTFTKPTSETPETNPNENHSEAFLEAQRKFDCLSIPEQFTFYRWVAKRINP